MCSCFNRAIPHHPLAKDAMAPQLLVQRPADPAGAIPRALHLPALQPREPAAHRVRPTPEEGQGRCMKHGTVRKQVSFDCFEMEWRWDILTLNLACTRKCKINIIQELYCFYGTGKREMIGDGVMWCGAVQKPYDILVRYLICYPMFWQLFVIIVRLFDGYIWRWLVICTGTYI